MTVRNDQPCECSSTDGTESSFLCVYPKCAYGEWISKSKAIIARAVKATNIPLFADAVLYRPMAEEDGEAGRFVVELRKRLLETTEDLTAKIQSLLEEHVFCEDGSYTFPDGDVWRVKEEQI